MVVTKRSKLIPGVLILSGLEGLAVLAKLVLTGSAEGGILFGLSAPRLAIAAAVLTISAVLLWIGIIWGKDIKLVKEISKSIQKQAWILVFVLGWGAFIFFFLQSEAYYQIIFRPFKRLLSPELFPQLRPLLIWTCLILIQATVGIALSEKDRLKEAPPQRHPLLVWLLLDLGHLLKGIDKSTLPILWQKHKASLLTFLGMGVAWIFVALFRDRDRAG